MLNLNYNIIECQRRTIAPVLFNGFDYLIVGGGGGGAAGGGAIGGAGGAGGQVVSGSFAFFHGTSATLTVGAGGVGGGAIGANGTAGTASTLVYSSTTYTANGGAAGVITSSSLSGGVTSTVDSEPVGGGNYLWGQNGSKGGDSPTGANGFGGGTGNQKFPWGTSPVLPEQNAFTNSGGGGGGFRWDSFNPGGLNPLGLGAAGMCMLRFADPRDVFTYTGDWDVFVYQNGFKYFYWQTDGTFTLLGKRD